MRAARQPRFRVGANGFEIKLAGVAADQRSADRFFVGHRGLTAYGAPPALCPMRANPNCASGRFRTEGKLFQLASLAGPMSCGQEGTARPLDSTIKVATLFHRLHQLAAVAGFGIYVPCPDSQGDATRDAQPSYKAWKDEALKVLRRDHNLPPSAISEREWTQLYVHGFTPDQAAERAEREYRSTRPPDWIKKNR